MHGFVNSTEYSLITHPCKRKGPGRPPSWVDQLLTDGPIDPENNASTVTHTPTPSADNQVPKEFQSHPQEDN